MFERSRSGQQNRASFFEVDAICYVEGGGGEGEHAPDVTFWTAVFSVKCPGKKIRCIAKGGKPVLQALAAKIVEDNLSNTFVAIDADYDYLQEKIIDDHRIIYTWGYSWENDVYNLDNMKLAYSALCHCGSLSSEVEQYMTNATKDIMTKLKWPARADYIALAKGTSVFPRNSPGRIIRARAGDGCPEVDLSEVVKLWRGAREKMTSAPVRGKLNQIDRHLCGKIMQLTMINILRASVRKFYKKMSISSEHIRDVALQSFRLFLSTYPDHVVTAHHRQQLTI